MTDGKACVPGDARMLLNERVRPALERQAALYDRLVAFGPMQDELIAEGDDLLRLMADRQSVVDELVRVHQGLEDVRGVWDEFINALEPGERTALGELLDAVKALAGRVHDQDAKTRQSLDGARDRVHGSLSGLGRAKGAVRAYAGGSARAPVHQDREA